MTAFSIQLKRPIWQNVVILTLSFWISSSLILDLVIMPSLYLAGMMTQAGFATAGYLIFWNFNRLEIIAAALVVTGILVIRTEATGATKWQGKATVLSLLLLASCLIETYFLTPQMCATGLQLNLFEPVAEIPATMNQLHLSYWGIEALKFIVGGTILSWGIRTSN